MRPRGKHQETPSTATPAHSGEIDAKHERFVSAFMAATRSGDLHALTQMLASDVRVVTDGGGKAAAALNVLDGADHAARFLIGATRKGWREDFTLRFAAINGLPGVIVEGPEGPVQTAAFEIEDDVDKGPVRGAQSGEVGGIWPRPRRMRTTSWPPLG